MVIGQTTLFNGINEKNLKNYHENYEYSCHHLEDQIMRIIQVIEEEEYRTSD